MLPWLGLSLLLVDSCSRSSQSVQSSRCNHHSASSLAEALRPTSKSRISFANTHNALPTAQTCIQQMRISGPNITYGYAMSTPSIIFPVSSIGPKVWKPNNQLKSSVSPDPDADPVADPKPYPDPKPEPPNMSMLSRWSEGRDVVSPNLRTFSILSKTDDLRVP